MYIGEVHHIQRLQAITRGRPYWFRLRRRERDVVRRHLGVRAEAHERDARQLRRAGAQGHVAQPVGDDGALEGYGAFADVVVFDLYGCVSGLVFAARWVDPPF